MRGSLLLGQSFLSRLRTWSIDNERHLLLVNEDVSQPTPKFTAAQWPAQSPRSLQDKYDTCVNLLSAAGCTDLKQRLDEATRAQGTTHK
jgi:hypothetical protein